MERLTDDFSDARATMKPPGAYNASIHVPKHTAQVVTSEKYKLNYEELKGRSMTFQEPLNYHAANGRRWDCTK